MPPLPSTTQSLTNRLNSLSESNKGVLQLIQRLSKLDFQPGTTPLNAEEGDARLELSAEIHENLKQIEDDLELLRQEVEDVVQINGSATRRRDSTRDSERARLAVLLARLTEDLKSSRSQYRRAQITAKRNADRAKLKERELLFSNIQSGSSTPTSTQRRRQNNSHATENEVIVGASSDVTSALRRTQQLLQGELQRSRFAQETLEQSNAALKDLGEKYTDLNTLLANSRNLVSTLLKSQKSDTWYLETTLYILITTVIWLIFRRWLYGPITWFIVWPLKLIFKVLFAVTPAVGAAKASSSAVPSASSSSRSLIVKPSASGAIPKRPVLPDDQRPYVQVGGGGRGYNPHVPRPDPSPRGSLSQKVGKMAEQNQQQGQQQQSGEQVPDHPQFRQQQQNEQQEGPVRRGDGTILQESDRPRNPKKKMWDEGEEQAKREAEQAQQQEGQAQQGSARRKRDEL